MSRSVKSQHEYKRFRPAEGGGGGNYLFYEYVDAPTPDDRRRLIERAEQVSNSAYHLVAGEMCLDMAYKDAAPQGNNWLMRARKNWHQAIGNVRSHEVNSVTARAASQLAIAPLYQHHIESKSVADLADIQTSYETLVTSAADYAYFLDNTHTHSLNRSEIVGHLGEVSVLLLLMRFGIESQDEQWMALPSLVTQDRSKEVDDEGLCKSWDVSVFTQYDAETPVIDPTYKVQVKAKRNTKGYAPDIAVVNVAHSLNIGGGNRGIDPTTIPYECYNALYSEDADLANISRRTLDLRQEKLLDILG